MCNTCGLCSGPPCLTYERNSDGDPCPECNPDSRGHDYSVRVSTGTVSGGCPLFLVAGITWVAAVAAMIYDVLVHT